MSDNILTSTRGKAMLANCPDYYSTSAIFKSYLQVVGAELDEYDTGIDSLLQAMFVQEAPIWALDIWEGELGIATDSSESMDQRQDKIISKIRGIGTVNAALVKNVAESYTNGTVEVIENPSLYSFTVKFVSQVGVPPDLDDLKVVIEEIKPAHLVVVYEITYITYGKLKEWGKAYGDLKAMTYEQIKNNQTE